MFLNLSNHPTRLWTEDQIVAAKAYHPQIVDMPFPHVSPLADTHEIALISEQIMDEIRKLNPVAVHLMGEFTLSFLLVMQLKHVGTPVMVSTSVRDVIDHPDGTKTTRFKFVRFREY